MNARTPQIEFARDCGMPLGLHLKAFRGGKEWRELVLPSPLALLGAAGLCDFQIEDDDVEDRHAVVLGLDGRILVCDLGSEQGTWRDGERVRAQWFNGAAEFRCGAFRILAEGEQAEVARTEHILEDDESSLANCTLVFQRRNEPALQYNLKRRVSLVGRERVCKVQLQSRTVWPYHALLIRGHEHLWVAHIADGGETSVDGQPVTLAKIENGQELCFGRVSTRVQLGESDSSRMLLPPVAEASVPSHKPEAAPRTGCSEEFVLDLLHQFRQMQRDTLREMRGWMTEMVQTLAVRPTERSLSDPERLRPALAEPPATTPPHASPAAPIKPASLPAVAVSAASQRDESMSGDPPVQFDDDFGPIALEQPRRSGDADPAADAERREEMADELRRRMQLIDQTIAEGDSLFSSVRRWLGHQPPK